MGWNQVAKKRESSLLADIDARAYFYFAHSYAALDEHARLQRPALMARNSLP